MAAIITDDFRRNSVTFLLDDIKDKNTGAKDSSNSGTFEYFIGIGKTDAWEEDAAGLNEDSQNFSTPLPSGTVLEAKEVIDNLAGAVAIKEAQAYHVIPRVNWEGGRRFKRWNENDPTMFDVSTIGNDVVYPCYAIAGEKIYICLDNNSNASYVSDGFYSAGASSNPPTGSSSTPQTDFSTEAPVSGDRNIEIKSDGYIWAYVADLDVSSKFNTDQFVSISSTATGTATDATTASGGVVYGFEILSAGSNINVNNSGNFKLVLNKDDGTAREIDLTVDNQGTGNSAKGVVMSNTTGVTYLKANAAGAVRASVVPASGTTADTMPVIRPLIAPKLGFGHTPTADLPAFYAGLAVNYNGDVEGELSTNIKYRQISLLRNPTRIDDDSASPPSGDGDYAQNEVYNTLRRIELNDTTTDLSGVVSGQIIEDVSTPSGSALTVTGAKAFVDYVDNTAGVKHIYFHQNESDSINQQEFTAGDGGTNSKISIDGGTALAYNTVTDPEYTPYSGEVYFLENRKPIQRASSQEEEIKLVIQF